MGSAFWREVKIDCGKEFRAVEIFQYSGNPQRKPRKPKTQISSPAQQNLNDKRAKRYLLQLILSNFGPGDYVAHLNYQNKYKPENAADALRIFRRFIGRINYKLKKRGLEPCRYICITAEGEVHGRIHHHVFLRCGLSRDEIEDLWWAKKETKKTRREMLGGCNVDRLKDWSGAGILEMAKYVTRQAKGKKKWTQSQNLKRPKIRRANDTRFSMRMMGKVLSEDVKSQAIANFIHKHYPGWQPVQIEKAAPETEHLWGGGLYLLLHRMEP